VWLYVQIACQLCVAKLSTRCAPECNAAGDYGMAWGKHPFARLGQLPVHVSRSEIIFLQSAELSRSPFETTPLMQFRIHFRHTEFHNCTWLREYTYSLYIIIIIFIISIIIIMLDIGNRRFCFLLFVNFEICFFFYQYGRIYNFFQWQFIYKT